MTHLHIPLDPPEYCLAEVEMTTSLSYIRELGRDCVDNRMFEVRHRLFPGLIVILYMSLINYKLK